MSGLIVRLRAILADSRGSAAASVIFTMFTALTLAAVTAAVITSLAATSAGSRQTAITLNSSVLQDQYLRSLNTGEPEPAPVCVGPFCSHIVGATDTGGLKVLTIDGGPDSTGTTEIRTFRPVTETMITGYDSLGRPIWSSPQDKTPHRFNSLTAAASHTCAIDRTGTAWCWGANNHGQLGDGTTTDRSAPVQVKTAAKFTSLAAGGADTTCGLATDGHAWCWGANTDGQVGTGPAEMGKDVLEPAAVSDGHAFASLHLGPKSACGIDTDKKTWCWGANPGNGTPDPSPQPVEVAGSHQFTALSMDATTTCATDTESKGWCWASTATGRTGVDPAPAPGIPTEITGGRTYKLIQVAPQTDPATTSFACAIDTVSDAWCWGENAHGQLGDGSTTASLVPVKVAGGHKLGSLALTAGSVCALDDTSHLMCWGENTHGQLGDGTTTDAKSPAAVDPGQTYGKVTANSAGTLCGITSSALRCWGQNADGAVTPGGPADIKIPTTLTGVSGATAATLGDGFTCTLAARSTAFCWGGNDHGQAGLGAPSPTAGPGIGVRHDTAPAPFHGFVKGGLL
jgi:hypothetical protein